MVSNFEHLSFNVGPTLLSWLEAHHPDVYGRILAADAHGGRAIAQAYGHAILPLCNERDLRTQVRWGILDFAHRFGRRPDGMWLPETAVSDSVLRVLAEEGIRFTILAPGQIEAVRPVGADDSAWSSSRRAARRPGALDTSRPYRWQHPSSPSAPSTSSCTTGPRPRPGLRPAHQRRHPRRRRATAAGSWSAATDGETFGHHHDGAERDRRAGAHAAEPAARRARAAPGRPARRAAARRTRPACAPAPGRAPTASAAGWPTAAATPAARRAGPRRGERPLRHALDVLRDWGVEVFERRGRELLRDPWAARDDYLGAAASAPARGTTSPAEHIVGDGHQAGRAARRPAQRAAHVHVVRLVLQRPGRHRDRPDPALRRPGHRPLPAARRVAPGRRRSSTILAEARSNDPEAGDGRQLWHEQVWPH